MTATTISPDTTAAVPVRQAVRTIPTARLVKSRAPQDVQHPIGLLDADQHRLAVGPGHLRGHHLRARRRSHLRELRERDRLPDVGDPADDRDPRRHQRVEPAQRAHDVHAGAEPRPRDRGQGDRDLPGRRRSRWPSPSLSVPSATWLAPRSRASTRSGTSRCRPRRRSCSATWSAWPIGFTLGVVLRNSAAAIVGYFVVSLVMPGILVLLAQVRSTGSRTCSRGSTGTTRRSHCSRAHGHGQGMGDARLDHGHLDRRSRSSSGCCSCAAPR